MSESQEQGKGVKREGTDLSEGGTEEDARANKAMMKAAKKRQRHEWYLERKAAKRAAEIQKVEEEGVVTAADVTESKYVFRDGLRCVEPYRYTFQVFSKPRWFGNSLVDVFCREFGHARTFVVSQIERGLLTVNKHPIAVDYQIRPRDSIENTIHRHEPPVIGQKVEIIAETDDLVVINKPSSLPVHPCGAFRHNCIMFIMAADYDVHRLDRMTSGVLLMAKSTAAAKAYMDDLQKGLMHKTYLARVLGKFPEGETTVDQPIKLQQELQGRGFRNCISPDGKPAQTVFQCLKYDVKTDQSIVLCKPLTGRTHQIRLHLKHLGHVIVNDPIYNDELYHDHMISPDDPSLSSAPEAAISVSEQDKDNVAVGCPWCARPRPDPTPDGLVMYLHALRYDGPGWRYEAPVPDWALGVSIPE